MEKNQRVCYGECRYGVSWRDAVYLSSAMHYHQVSNDCSDDIFGARLVLAVTFIFAIYYAAGYIYFEYFVEHADATRFLGKAIVLGS